jgi:hypothetical protein
MNRRQVLGSAAAVLTAGLVSARSAHAWFQRPFHR